MSIIKIINGFQGYIKGIILFNELFLIVFLFYFFEFKSVKKKMLINLKIHSSHLEQETIDQKIQLSSTDNIFKTIKSKLIKINNKFIILSLLPFLVCVILISLKCFDNYYYTN